MYKYLLIVIVVTGRVKLVRDQVDIVMCRHVLVVEYSQTSNFLCGEIGCVEIKPSQALPGCALYRWLVLKESFIAYV